MTLNFSFWGMLAGWLLMPRWWKQNNSSYISTAAYFCSLVVAIAIVRLNVFDLQARLFVFGMVIQFILFSVGGCMLRVWRQKR